jgi:hypothetical protein
VILVAAGVVVAEMGYALDRILLAIVAEILLEASEQF